MIAISNSTFQTATTLAQALAANAPAKTITADQATVAQLEKTQTSSSQDTAFDISV